MKRFALILAALLLICAAAAAQHRSEAAIKALNEDITRAACNHNSYEFFPIKDTPAPKGYKPFYISHYGRHGSRSGWGGDRYAYVIHVLERGEKAGILTPGGDSLLAATRKEFALYGGMDGRLTPRGVREHAAIADRMYSRYPQVFKGKKKVRAVSSTVQRCIVSMTGFTNSLVRRNPKLDILPDTGERIMEYISPDGDWQEATKLAYEKAQEEVRKLPDYRTIWQTFAVLLPVRSVGVMGDQRTYEYTCAIRSVNSVDAMTADWTHLPYETLATISNRIINEVRGINRVVYDISSKPPATIEWE